ncbi:MAG: ATP-grasp domain-containing protein [Thiobacillus sp.]
MRRFEKAADELGLQVALITRSDLERLPRFDALFIRDTTYPNHYTYSFSRRAAAEGLVVIDAPIRYSNATTRSIFAELHVRRHIPAPRTLVVHQGNIGAIVPTLGGSPLTRHSHSKPFAAYNQGIGNPSPAR